MSGSDQRKRITTLEAFFCVLAIFGTAIVIYATGTASGVEAGRNQVTAHEHYEAVKKDALKACLNLQGNILRDCAIKAIETAQEKSISRQDLYAQQDMSKWAFWLFILTMATFLLSAGGLWALVKTITQGKEGLDRAKDANEIAEKIGVAQARAYLTIKSVHVGHNPATLMFTAHISLTNTGNSPAQNIISSGSIITARGDVNHPLHMCGYDARPFGHSNIGVGDDIIVVEFSDTPITKALVADIAHLIFAIEISGTDVFGNPFRGIIKGIASKVNSWDVATNSNILASESSQPTYDERQYKSRVYNPKNPDPAPAKFPDPPG